MIVGGARNMQTITLLDLLRMTKFWLRTTALPSVELQATTTRVEVRSNVRVAVPDAPSVKLDEAPQAEAVRPDVGLT